MNKQNAADFELPKANSHLQEWALILKSQAFQESDKIIQVYTPNLGKISLIAKAAQNSRKRFGSSLEFGNLVKLNLKVPRNFHNSHESTLWFLESCDLRDTFEHLKTNYHALQWRLFVASFIIDIYPDADPNEASFKTLGRFLRESKRLEDPLKTLPQKLSHWPLISFWAWQAHHLGFGDLTEDLEQATHQSIEFWTTWHECLSQSEASFEQLFESWKKNPNALVPLTRDNFMKIYLKWIKNSSMHWNFFEKDFFPLQLDSLFS